MQLDKTEAENEIKASLYLAIERTDSELLNINSTTKDVFSEYSHLKLKEINEAIRLGGLGKYGRTYKLTTQEVMMWIREYVKSKKSNLL